MLAHLRIFAYRGAMTAKAAVRPRTDPALHEALRKFKAEVFQVLGHPRRIHIVECLRDGELSVSEIQQRVGLEAPAVSQHLAQLRAKKLVTARKDGNKVFYGLRDRLL